MNFQFTTSDLPHISSPPPVPLPSSIPPMRLLHRTTSAVLAALRTSLRRTPPSRDDFPTGSMWFDPAAPSLFFVKDIHLGRSHPGVVRIWRHNGRDHIAPECHRDMPLHRITLVHDIPAALQSAAVNRIVRSLYIDLYEMQAQTPPSPGPVVILSCAGAPDGDLNAVRSLGGQGLHVIVLSEYDRPPARHSRHCSEFIHVPGYTEQPSRLTRALAALHDRLGCAPVVLPTADPDVLALDQARTALGPRVRAVLPSAELVRQLTAKDLFDSFSVAHGMPVPHSCVPRSLEDVRAFAQTHPAPYIVKPDCAGAWRHPLINEQTARTRAFVLHDEPALMRVCGQLEPVGLRLILQEYIPGDDTDHCTVDIFVGHDDQVLTCAGVKLRHFPPHVGAGCYCESRHMPALEAQAASIMRRIGFHGVANLDFKRHAGTGEFKLFEINPRLSHWHILATHSGVNLPLLAYQDAIGLPYSPPARRTGLRYVNGRHDLSAVRQYVREGQWSWPRYARSLLSPRNVYQRLWLTDPMPFLRSWRQG